MNKDYILVSVGTAIIIAISFITVIKVTHPNHKHFAIVTKCTEGKK
jgi:hypothetical protein